LVVSLDDDLAEATSADCIQKETIVDRQLIHTEGTDLHDEYSAMSGNTSDSPRAGKDLFDATVPFVEEYRGRSWWYVSSTLAVLVAVLTVAAIAPWWPLRLAASIAGGLVLVRAFILYHDFMHGSLLPGSRLAQIVFNALGLLMLTPPRHWRYAHNFHHAHVGKVIVAKKHVFPVLTSDIGSFPLMSTERWRRTTIWQRVRYRISRHPVTILCAYVTIFLLVGCLNPLARNPRKYWDGAISLLAHGGLIAWIWLAAGFDAALFAVVIPFAIAAAMGAYLFYAQHTYEGLRILPPEEWTYFEGALESSSYMQLGPIMNWVTGNIGYHHVHHLNPHIPFYRLPEAMAAIPELQQPTTTSLRPRDILACFQANLWDASTQRMVSYPTIGRDCEVPRVVP
jgi:omega-6 fatty acid desaturase (delta-12 desaturase)